MTLKQIRCNEHYQSNVVPHYVWLELEPTAYSTLKKVQKATIKEIAVNKPICFTKFSNAISIRACLEIFSKWLIKLTYYSANNRLNKQG